MRDKENLCILYICVFVGIHVVVVFSLLICLYVAWWQNPFSHISALWTLVTDPWTLERMNQVSCEGAWLLVRKGPTEVGVCFKHPGGIGENCVFCLVCRC